MKISEEFTRVTGVNADYFLFCILKTMLPEIYRDENDLGSVARTTMFFYKITDSQRYMISIVGFNHVARMVTITEGCDLLKYIESEKKNDF